MKRNNFNKAYTFFYLPISIVLGIIIILGRVERYSTLSFSTFNTFCTSLRLLFPLIITVFSLLSYILLLSQKKSGIILIIIRNSLLSLLSLFFSLPFLLREEFFPYATIYLVVAVLSLGILIYYASRVKTLFREEENIEYKYIEEPSEEEKEVEVQNEKVIEEEDEEPKEEIILKPRTKNTSPYQCKKQTDYYYAFFSPDEPIIVKHITSIVADGYTDLDITLFVHSPRDIEEASFILNEMYEIKLPYFLLSGSEETLHLTINTELECKCFRILESKDSLSNEVKYTLEDRKLLPLLDKKDISTPIKGQL